MGLDQSVKVYRKTTEDGRSILSIQEEIDTLYRKANALYDTDPDEARNVMDEADELSNVLSQNILYEWTGRKENHIHSFFNKKINGGVVNCKTHVLDSKNIEELTECLIRINEDNSLAAELLPTQYGFFFGGTDYDDYYFEDIEREMKAFQDILTVMNDDIIVTYWAWW